MTKIVPFKAVRPAANKVALVTTRPYDEYSAAELASWLDFNPYSFLHIINPAFINQQKIDPIRRYQIVGTKYQDFKKNNTFITESKPVMYLYEIQSSTSHFIGIMAGTPIKAYKKNKIKRHENTLDYRVENMKNYFKESRFNTEPVLMMHEESSELNDWMNEKRKQTPLYDFATTNKEEHRMWSIDTPEEIERIQQIFEKIDTLYIADGHHRTESIRQLSDEQSKLFPELKYFMSFLICENKLRINPYHRLIHDLNGHSTKDFLIQIEEKYHIEKVHEFWKPKEKHQFCMYIDKQFYALTLKEKPNKNGTILESLDAKILYQTILRPILGIEDIRTDSRIGYVAGNKSIVELVEKIDAGDFCVGFILFPSTIEDIKKLAHAELTMPPKSTYIEPKIRNGLVIYEY